MPTSSPTPRPIWSTSSTGLPSRGPYQRPTPSALSIAPMGPGAEASRRQRATRVSSLVMSLEDPTRSARRPASVARRQTDVGAASDSAIRGLRGHRPLSRSCPSYRRLDETDLAHEAGRGVDLRAELEDTGYFHELGRRPERYRRAVLQIDHGNVLRPVRVTLAERAE